MSAVDQPSAALWPRFPYVRERYPAAIPRGVVMRPRLLPDTHLLPSEQGVVIRGPRHTVALPAPGLYPWLERLRPFLDGSRSVGELVADLPPQAAQHVRTLVELLLREGFVRDAGADLPHTLSPRVRAQHAAMIDFIALRSDSPEGRFERYRTCSPVVAGSGHLASALVLALLASGIEHVRLLVPRSGDRGGPGTDMARLRECVELLRAAGGCFRYEEIPGDLSEPIQGIGTLLLGADAPDREAQVRARALAARSGAWYGQAVVSGPRVLISAVSRLDDTSAPWPDGGSAGEGEERPSPYLGGPVAALAANQLCLHLLRQVAGLDESESESESAGAGAGAGGAPAASGAAVLDLATARFVPTEPARPV
ncbi:hypothetical protein OG455_00830 [Kitasatospora sp. NBC_01287]|uniref:hypothetical protein n=1 Tax=Kitasatospora sp. NBC_01287 TaxID=2903573 RepID=UPI002258D490|nr:hypothetical protein [Kitasatospora sp. NBC_01287]MCX4744069.1 hypothetical protein [Kitasatospora sp. NBC_01287]